MKYLHTMVRVSDLDQSLDFYCNKLGLKEVRRMESKQGRFTLVYLAAPPEMRSRLYGVLSVCIGSAPIGFLCLGLLADAVGATPATATSGVLGLLMLLATYRWWRQLGPPRSGE